MAELLAAIDEPAFNWYPKWVELNEKGLPKNPIKDGMCQPPTIKILWSTSNGREMSCKVTPDKGLFGPEYVLATPYPISRKSFLFDGEKIIRRIPST